MTFQTTYFFKPRQIQYKKQTQVQDNDPVTDNTFHVLDRTLQFIYVTSLDIQNNFQLVRSQGTKN